MATLFNQWLRSDPARLRMRRQGDAARDRQDWPEAEAAYRQHLAAFPADGPIWVQFGHVLKEQDKLDEALAAYRKAAAMPDAEADAKLHLAHLLARVDPALVPAPDAPDAVAPDAAPKPRLPAMLGNPARLREGAAEAFAAEDWPLAAAALRHRTKAEPRDPALLLQYGHALQRLGLFAPARAAFEEAARLAPADPEPLLRRAALAGDTGAFAEAATLLDKARSLGADVTDALARQPAPPGTPPHPYHARFEDEPRPAFRVFLSSAVGIPRSDAPGDVAAVLGKAHYSYSLVARCYMEALDRMGVAYEVLPNPEYVSDIRTLSDCPVNLHLGFYPPDAPRLLKGAYNVTVLFWEFERLPLPSEIISYHAFADPNVMLTLPDEIWSGSSFGAEAIRASGLPAVHAAPAPVLSGIADAARPGPASMRVRHRLAERLQRMCWTPLAILPQMMRPMLQEAERRASDLPAILGAPGSGQDGGPGGKRPTVFLTIFNVHDYRKQIKPVIEAFLRLAGDDPSALLLIKLSLAGGKASANEYLFHAQMADGGEVAPPFVSDRVWLSADVLSRDEMLTLYDLADFYISSSHGEGQNLPLIEAMGRGCVPVCVDHTSMRDYIDDGNAVVVRSTFEPFNTRLADRYRMAGLRTYYVSPRDALDALRRALALTPAEYATKSAAAHATVARVFGLAPFEANLRRALDAAAARLGHADHPPHAEQPHPEQPS